jgi:ABC-type transport system involved in multi-copper enzyme maturation permease subunit
MNTTIFAIAKNTFRETSRDRVLLSGVFVIFAIILFTLFIGSISLDQGTRMIIDFSVTAIYALQMFVAIFIGSMLIYKEIERKTFYLLLPKPVTRTEIIIGKCLGLTATTILVTLLSTSALFAILLMQGGKHFMPAILISVFLSTLEAILLILISMLFSGITSPILAATSTIVIFFVGHAENIFRYIFTTNHSTAIEFITRGIYYAMPNLEKFNSRNEIVYGTTPSLTMIGWAIIYTLLYSLLLLAVTHIAFKKKDF